MTPHSNMDAGFTATASAPAAMPPELRAAFYSALAKDSGTAHALNSQGCASVASLKACFTESGAHFSGAAPLSLQLAAWGRGDDLAKVTATQPRLDGNEVRYAHGNLTEWWKVLPVGFEQGFTVNHRPAGSGELTLALTANDPATESKGDLAWGKLRYGELVVSDARGHVIPATLKTEGRRVLIAVNDAGATYPLTVDPLVWIEQKVTASDGASGDEFGTSVALSGTAALVGAYHATVNGHAQQGAAYVFSDAGGTWTQTAKLVANDGAAGDGFGFSVALSGTTALVGALHADVGGNSEEGAAYVFSDTGGSWTQAAKLTAGAGATPSNFGQNVALTGTTAVVSGVVSGGSNAGDGLTCVFSGASGTWTQTQEITTPGGAATNAYVQTAAISGPYLLVGAPLLTVNGNAQQGGVYVFSDASGTWGQVAVLAASDGAANDGFGSIVALSGTTAVIGASNATVGGNAGQGAAYVFSNEGGIWAQAAKLTENDGAAYDYFGTSVALSGTTALVGANNATVNGNAGQGAAYVFSDAGGSWMQTAKLTASDGAASNYFGVSVALSGTTTLVGALGATVNGNASQGAAYFESQGNLSLVLNAPASATQGSQYQGEMILTNNAATATPAVAAAIPVPSGASFVSATPAQGSCTPASTSVTCALGSLGGNGGTAKVAVTFKATGAIGASIANTASINYVSPALTASANTAIIGTPVVSLSPASLSFSSVAVGSTATQTVTLTNTGTADLTGIAFSLTGTNASDFSETSTCAASLPSTGGNSCTISVSFKPTAGGARSATLSIASDAATSPNTVTLTGTGDVPPVANNQTLAVYASGTADGTLVATPSSGGGALIYTAVTQPAHGTLTLTASTGAFTYAAHAGFTGTDSFTFSASDGIATSNTATVTVTVSDPAPTANNASVSTTANQAVSGQLTAAPGYTGQVLTYSVDTPPAHGQVVVTASSGAFTYTPATGYVGTDSFTYTAGDGTVSSTAAIVTIKVNDVAPTAANGSVSTQMDQPVSGQLSATPGYTGQMISYAIVAQPAHGTLTLTASSGAFTYTPTAGYTGSDSFTFEAGDGLATSNVATVTITVNAAPVPPTAPLANNQSFSIADNMSWQGTLTATGTGTLTYAITSKPGNGIVTLTASSGAFTYTPNPAFTGSDGFEFTASNGTATSQPATVTITVTPASGPAPVGPIPPMASNASFSTGPGGTVIGKLSATGGDGQPLTYTVVIKPVHGTLTLNAQTGAFTYTPAAGFDGDSFTYTVSDGTTTSSPATVTFARHGGGGAFGIFGLLLLAPLVGLRKRRH